MKLTNDGMETTREEMETVIGKDNSVIIYSPKLKIPIVKLVFHEDGNETQVEILNHRSHKTEMIALSSFVAMLVREKGKY